MGNERVTDTLYFLPYAEMVLACLALETLVLVIDGSAVGRGCVALIVHVVYKVVLSSALTGWRYGCGVFVQGSGVAQEAVQFGS